MKDRENVENIIMIALYKQRLLIGKIIITYSILFAPLHLSAQKVSSNVSFSVKGVWENTSRFVEFFDQANDKTLYNITLKPFYQYWYDGVYENTVGLKTSSIARIGDALYLEYWCRGSAVTSNSLDEKGVFWRPCGNLKEISLDEPHIKKELKAYYVLNNSEFNQVFEIRYWIANVLYKQEQARIEFKKNDEIALSLTVDKYLFINGTVYTCATGRRTTVRNVKTQATLPGKPIYSDDSNLMVLSDPYLVKSDVSDVETEIAKHNAIQYPPRSGKARFEEPSVYQKMENNEIPLNGGSYFKP